MAATPKSITLIGSGSLAHALGPALKAAGYRIDAVVARPGTESRRRATSLARKIGAKCRLLQDFKPAADIIWLLHTDDALAGTAETLARAPAWRGKVVLHSSGALSSDVLAPLRRAGAYTGSLHPMMTFVPGTAPEMGKVPFAVEGDRKAIAAAKQIARKLGAEVFPIRKSSKVLYHALGSFSSPLVVATLVTAERVGRAAGLTLLQTRRVMAGILRQTLNNYLERGPEAAFSGPIKRGDLETVRRHLLELKRVPDGQDVYRALVRSALRDLPSARKKELLLLIEKNPTADKRGSTRISKDPIAN
ncbi:MAG: Rossmann-like and DUF2520 domain-containing protein [Actinomycetota bacterium]